MNAGVTGLVGLILVALYGVLVCFLAFSCMGLAGVACTSIYAYFWNNAIVRMNVGGTMKSWFDNRC